MTRTLCSSSGPLLDLKLVIAAKSGHFLPHVQLDKENYAINGKYRYFPAISALLNFAKSSVTTLLTRASLRFILPDDRLVVENPIANAR
ncbi:hypothetical protein HA51_18395 [Pantoea rwandensis]|uniref:Uncharacterized protein n=2 Tax=Pantoea rwandensis TaxID=1076550 RepID=A0A1X1CT77_9GAMM|nr:hypothetical protein HA51_18395 [Pantoea rwandensis]